MSTHDDPDADTRSPQERFTAEQLARVEADLEAQRQLEDDILASAENIDYLAEFDEIEGEDEDRR